MARPRTLIAAAGLAATVLTSRSPAQPIHNSCSNALPINPCGGTYTGTTVGATQEGPTPTCATTATRDVWHSVAITTRGYLEVYTCPASFDTVISLHSMCPTPQSFQVACNDNSAYCGAAYPNASYFRAQVSPGTYLIRVAGVNGTTGTYTLNTLFTPINDSCAEASIIGDGATQGSTTCASIDGSADCAPLALAPDIWYHYLPRCNGTLLLYICPASFDTVLSVHNGCPGTSSNQIACNDDSMYCGTAYPRTSSLSLPVVFGGTYLIRVSGFNGAIGTFVLNSVLTSEAPANDNCANAIPVGDGDTPFVTCGATTDGPVEFLCNFPNSPQISSDVWYRYSVPCSGRATVSIPTANYPDARLAVYNATCPATSGQAVACNSQSNVFFPTVAGQQFLIRVGGSNSQGGAGTLRILCTPDLCYANCDNSTVTPILNVNDFTCFLNLYAAGASRANCDNSTTAPLLNVNDFTCFINRYAAGCP